MRGPVPPPPAEDDPLQIWLRECPEVLPALRGRGVDVAEAGCRPFSHLPSEAREAALEATRWRIPG